MEPRVLKGEESPARESLLATARDPNGSVHWAVGITFLCVSMSALTLTIDLEDPTKAYRPDGRYVLMADHILDLCDEVGCKATFFTVGKVARSVPSLVRKISERGHEIAYHSAAHLPLTHDTPHSFKAQTHADKAFIEDLTGQPLSGFRAPCYSLTPRTVWATQVLAELEFLYSSSIMPSLISMEGFKDKPNGPFLWESGLVEIPMPMIGLGNLRLPFCGGIYLYLTPVAVSRLFFKALSKHTALWTYAHPYDFDRDEPYSPMPDTPAWMSRLLYAARSVAEKKIRAALALHDAGPPLRDIAQKTIAAASRSKESASGA